MESLEDRHMMSAAQIIAENQLQGTTAWEIDGNLSSNIEGYAAQFSVNLGETVQFKVNTSADDYRLDIYRMGWYGGAGGRQVATIQPTNLQDQPNALFHQDTNTADASNWHLSASWAVPANAVSGVYIAKLVREDGVYGENFIIFVVRDDEGHSDLLFQTSDTTWQAYNLWGGSSLYNPNYPHGRALAVSYSRPFTNYDTHPLDFYYGEEFAMTRFLERNGFDVSYTSGIDTDRRGHELLEHKVFLSVGHDEYWSGGARANVEAARDAGVNLAFFSGNTMYWKTRWEADNSGNPYTMLTSYKETLANAKIDPLDDVWTGTWRDPRFSTGTDGGQPENAVMGTIFTVNRANNFGGESIQVSGSFAAMRFWRNTLVATLGPQNSLSLGDRALGYEWDEDLDNGFRPAGLINLSSTTMNVSQKLQDYGSTFGPGVATHSLTMYKVASGALVFSAASIQYSWALDDYHPVYEAATDRNLQQATINLFADMGVQPGSLMSGLIHATASTDSLAPVSVILSPLVGATLPTSGNVTITGTAQERGGGAVAVVEVSIDGGLTWRRATGRNNWTYTFAARGSGSFTIMSRAVDDSGNIEVNGPRVEVNPNASPGIYSLWRNTDVPGDVDGNDNRSIEVGLRFVSETNGLITGLRFYKNSANTGTHIASLWTNSGQLLARATFTGETTSGWQQVNFANPVFITAGTTYVASYFAPNGRYAFDENYFRTQGISNGPLHAVSQGVAGGNGVYRYGSGSIFPDQTYNNSNYWVDVVLNTLANNDHTPPTVESFRSADGSSTFTTDAAIAIKLSEAINVTTVNSSSVQLLNPDLSSMPGGCCSTPGGWCSGCPLQQGANTRVIPTTLSYDPSSRTILVTPNSPLDTLQIYTVLMAGGANGVKDLAGNTLSTDSAASFLTPAQAASVRSTLWSDTAVPAMVDGGDAQPIEVGVRFTADTNGSVSGIRFYKSTANTGTHIANLWTSTGQLLATATFTNETASGWQQVNFATPVAVTAGTTYVASYHSENGHYSITRNYFTSAYDAGMLNVSANGGVYRNGAGGFPTSTYQASNYWVDVVLRTAPVVDNIAPTVAAFSPAADTSSVPVNSSATVRFSEAIDTASITASTVKLTDGNNNPVPATLTYNSGTLTATITPTSPLAFGMTYTTVVLGGQFGVRDVAGNPFAQTVASSFTTVPAPAPDTTPPTVVSVNPPTGSANILPTSSFTVTFSKSLNAATVDANKLLLLKNATNRITISVTYDAATRTATITPASALENATSYTIYIPGGSVGPRDLAGNAMVQDFVSSFTTAPALISSTLWPSTTTPATIDNPEALALELGVKFTANTNGYITGVRFYKSAANTGTHVAHLWTNSGQLLATANFTNETASGWQQVNFATPVAITAGTTYVASYFAPNGHYSVNRNYFNSSFNSGNLTVSAAGGVYRYGSASAFPNQTYQNSNYWVAPVLGVLSTPDLTPPTVTATSPANGTVNVATNTTVTVSFSEPINAATIDTTRVKILDGNTLVTANVAYNSSNNSVTITPVVALANSKTYTIVVEGGMPGVWDVAGNPLSQTFNATFSTAPPAPPTDTIPPTVTSFSPSSSATSVAVNSPVTITFSEALTGSTVNTNTVRLLNGSTVVAATVAYNASTRTASITPSAVLANSQTYTISVTGGSNGVKDLAGNALAQTATSSFTTVAASDTAPPTVTSVSPTNGATGITVSSTVTATFSEAINAATITGSTVRLLDGSTQVAATVTYNASNRTATITPTAALSNSKTYTVSILGGSSGVKDLAGNALAQTVTSTFTTVAATTTTSSLWNTSTTPAILDEGQSLAAELGVRFSSTANGYITGIRFYKSGANTGTHVANLWTSGGQLLATATFTNETASGWQTVTFANPVAITAGTTYVASYFAPNGHFSVNRNYFTSQFTSGNLRVPVTGGVYAYSSSGGFPNQSYRNSNYWVDVLMTTTQPPPDTTAPAIASITPTNGATGITVSSTVTATFSEAINAATITGSTVRLLDGSTQVAATVTYNASNRTATITPTAALSNSKTYTVSILGGSSGVKDLAGNALAQTVTSTFTTVAATTTTSSLWNTSTTPAILDEGQSLAAELGVRFSSTANGYITGIRFYKSGANTGTHVANLWTSGGQLLATATFTNETASGWQTVTFANPVAITAGTTYVASYFAPNGHFSVNRNYFTSQFTSGNLRVPVTGGVYAYSSSGGFPNQSYRNSNYWVDVLFATSI